jgi:hypothetical protein
MSQTTQEKNKALVLEAFDFNLVSRWTIQQPHEIWPPAGTDYRSLRD